MNRNSFDPTPGKRRRAFRWSFSRRQLMLSAAPLALMAFVWQALPAFATIDNTVVVTGTDPGGGTVTTSVDETVDVEDLAPGVTVLKSISFPTGAGGDVDGDGKGDVGDTVTYTYTVTNSGNTSLTNVGVTDAHDGGALTITVPTTVTTDNGAAAAGLQGDSSDTVTSDAVWETLGPGDVITFTSSYTIVAGDLAAAGGGTGTGFTGNPEPDGYLDNTATVSGTSGTGPGATTVTDDDTRSVQLDIAPALTVTKVASDTTEVAAGDTITYTYTVSNTGNVPITNVTLADTHKGVAGALTPTFTSWTTNSGSSVTGNTITLLQPGDIAVFEATYTVTQTDVETLQ